MSTYYTFYAAKISQDNEIKILGPFAIDKDDKFQLFPILSRSRSFINIDEFDSFCYPVNESMLSKEELSKLHESAEFYNGMYYYLPYSDVKGHATNGLVRGYATLDQIKYAAECGYDLFCDWMYPIYPPEVAAEMPPEEKKKYGQISYIDTMSTGYLCEQLILHADPWNYDISENEFCYLLTIG